MSKKWYILVYTIGASMFLFEVAKIFEARKIPYAIVGGLAVALHGAVRGTIDIDIAIKWTLKDLKAVEEALHELHLVSSLPVNANKVFSFRKEYIEDRHMIAWNFYDPDNPARQVDIIINYDLTRARSVIKKTSWGSVRVLSKEDLIKMKRQAGRPQDLNDAKALEEL